MTTTNRRICRQCQKVPVRKAEHVFCSEACYRLSRRKDRGRCKICRERPVSKQSRTGTCGRRCGWRARGPLGVHQSHAALLVMRRKARANFIARTVARLQAEVAALQVATSDAERAKVLLRIYQRGRHDGAAAAYYRYAVAARR